MSFIYKVLEVYSRFTEQLRVYSFFPNRVCILKDVFLEVFKGVLHTEIERLLQMKFIEELDFSADINVLKEYARLKKIFGSGESACMAYCKYHQDVLASSNLKDVKKYCEEMELLI